MTVEINPEDHAILEQRVASGEFATVEQALHAAVNQLWEAHQDWLKYAHASIQEGLDDAAEGRVVDGDEVMQRMKARANRTAA